MADLSAAQSVAWSAVQWDLETVAMRVVLSDVRLAVPLGAKLTAAQMAEESATN